MDLKNIKSVHFVGIKGVAMTALAILAKEMGIQVSGSDINEDFPTQETLRRFKIEPMQGFNSDHIQQKLDFVIYTGAHNGRHNIEVQTAIKYRIPVASHGQALGLFMKDKVGIAVAGSHGKTTTSAMIAQLLHFLGQDPSFTVGCGEIIDLHTSGHAGTGKYFVTEADEYMTDPTSDRTPRFFWLNPQIIVMTNIDFDHPDVYRDVHEVQKAFVKFTQNLDYRGVVILNSDDPKTREILYQIKHKIITYGTSPLSTYRLNNIHIDHHITRFQVFYQDHKLGDFSIKIPGMHNALNATATIATLKTLNFPINEIKTTLANFSGTKRRFEFLGEVNGKLLYDDYAHHPVEIAATLKGIKETYKGKRIIVIFQPHTYSRTQKLLKDFSTSFKYADNVVISEIYASAREKPIPGISGKLLFEEIKQSQKDVFFAPEKAHVLEYIHENSRPNDLILTMGAGDIYSWIPDILKNL